jgi:acyl-lipid (7-3)-desaturase (Delta-4 desaturase)
MPPDADKVRQRKTDVQSPLINKSESLKTLSKLRDNEVCIDGVVYDIDSFDHPGGDQIKIFGGNDATVQYRMIHPHHTGKQLEKLTAIGKVVDFTSE